MQRPALQKCIAVALALLVWQGAAMAVGLRPAAAVAVAGGRAACGRYGGSRASSPPWPSACCASAGALPLGLVLGRCCWRWRRGGCGCWSFCCGPMSRPSSPCRWRRSSSSGADLDEHPAAGGVHLVSHGVPGDLLQHPARASKAPTGPAAGDGPGLSGCPAARRLRYIYAAAGEAVSCCPGAAWHWAMSWKAGVAAEVIGVVGGSIGERLYEAKVYFQTPDLLAWTVVIVVCSVGFEKLVLWLLRRGFAAWEGR